MENDSNKENGKAVDLMGKATEVPQVQISPQRVLLPSATADF